MAPHSGQSSQLSEVNDRNAQFLADLAGAVVGTIGTRASTTCEAGPQWTSSPCTYESEVAVVGCHLLSILNKTAVEYFLGPRTI